MIAAGSRIYLAARYSRRQELLDYALELQERGYEITSTWIDGHHETRPGIDDDATDVERATWAAEDVSDVRRADWLVSFTEQERGRGGRHVEFGMALAWGQRLVLIGANREHVFHCLPDVLQFDTWVAFLAWLPARLHQESQEALR
jgi:hypothetical protein